MPMFQLPAMFAATWGYNMAADYHFEKYPEKKKETALGSPLWAKDSRGRYYFMPVKLGGLELYPALVSFTGKKNIIETPLIGYEGSVKELINIDSYEISIRGFVIDDNNSFPDEKIMKLQELWKKNESLSLECALTDIFLQEDDKVIIKGLRFPEMKGSEHIQAYEIECLSDQYFELIIK
jgi:hypothetical protein